MCTLHPATTPQAPHCLVVSSLPNLLKERMRQQVTLEHGLVKRPSFTSPDM